jgi:hypothetical protein
MFDCHFNLNSVFFKMTTKQWCNCCDQWNSCFSLPRHCGGIVLALFAPNHNLLYTWNVSTFLTICITNSLTLLVQSSLFLPVSCCFFIHALRVVTCFPHTYEEALRIDEINCSTNIKGAESTLASCLSHNKVFLSPFWGHTDYNITILMLNRTNNCF